MPNLCTDGTNMVRNVYQDNDGMTLHEVEASGNVYVATVAGVDKCKSCDFDFLGFNCENSGRCDVSRVDGIDIIWKEKLQCQIN